MKRIIEKQPISMGLKSVMIAIFSVFLFSGCAGFRETFGPIFAFDDLIPYKEGAVSVSSTNAKERLAIFYLEGKKTKLKIKFCAEPLPDAGSYSSGNIEISANEIAKLAASGEKKTIALYNRHPVTEFYKAGLFAICQMSVSGILESSVTEKLLHQLVEKSADMFIAREAKIK